MRRKTIKPGLVIRCLREGLEAPQEIADELRASVSTVEGVLTELVLAGAVRREARPTFFLSGGENGRSFRHQLVGEIS